MRSLVAAVLVWGLAASVSAEEVSSCARVETDLTRTLCHEVVLPAPRAEVWRLLTTSDGLRTWAAPVAAIDLRVGGLWEASYDPDASLGDAANIHNRVLSYLPERMLSLRAERAPPGFPHADLLGETWSVIELEAIDAAQTRVRVSGLGYRNGAGFDDLYAMFAHGNALTLAHLHERITQGPIDWAARLRAADMSRP